LKRTTLQETPFDQLLGNTSCLASWQLRHMSVGQNDNFKAACSVYKDLPAIQHMSISSSFSCPILINVHAEDMDFIPTPKGWMFPQFASLKRVVKSHSGFVCEDRLKLRVKILIHENKQVGGTHCITHLMQSTTQDLTFGNLIHSILHIHSMFTQACVTATFKKEDKITHAQSCQVWSDCCCHSSGAGLAAVWH